MCPSGVTCGQRSRSHEGHYGTWHTALRSCTHIPNIIELSRKTKMLWPRQENTIQKTILLLLLSEACPDLSFQIGQLYLVCGCMTIRRCVAYRNDLRGTLTFDLKGLTVMHPHTKYYWTISKDKNVMAQTRKYYSKNNYLTLRSGQIIASVV
jgi:hypothetical protein